MNALILSAALVLHVPPIEAGGLEPLALAAPPPVEVTAAPLEIESGEASADALASLKRARIEERHRTLGTVVGTPLWVAVEEDDDEQVAAILKIK